MRKLEAYEEELVLEELMCSDTKSHENLDAQHCCGCYRNGNCPV